MFFCWERERKVRGGQNYETWERDLKTAKEKGRNFLLFNAMGKQKQKKTCFPKTCTVFDATAIEQ